MAAWRSTLREEQGAAFLQDMELGTMAGLRQEQWREGEKGEALVLAAHRRRRRGSAARIQVVAVVDRVLLLLAVVVIGAQEMARRRSRGTWRAAQPEDSAGHGVGVHRGRLVARHGESVDATSWSTT